MRFAYLLSTTNISPRLFHSSSLPDWGPYYGRLFVWQNFLSSVTGRSPLYLLFTYHIIITSLLGFLLDSNFGVCGFSAGFAENVICGLVFILLYFFVDARRKREKIQFLWKPVLLKLRNIFPLFSSCKDTFA